MRLPLQQRSGRAYPQVDSRPVAESTPCHFIFYSHEKLEEIPACNFLYHPADLSAGGNFRADGRGDACERRAADAGCDECGNQ